MFRLYDQNCKLVSQMVAAEQNLQENAQKSSRNSTECY
jgi:hypothetical protein